MSTPIKNIIVAIAPDLAIGRQGQLLFNVREDLRRFKSLTMGHPIIMGRKTFQSLPKGALPGRRNIVVTRDKDFHAPGVETAASLNDAYRLCDGDDQLFVIGGASIYAQAIGDADRLMLTRFDRTLPDADCFFPSFDTAHWHIDAATDWTADEATGVNYRFEDLSRR